MVSYDVWPKIDPRILLYLMMVVLFLDHIWEIILAKRQVSEGGALSADQSISQSFT